MMTRGDSCDAEMLRGLSSDRLSQADLERLEEHLESCPTCRSELDREVAEDDCLISARRSLQSDATGWHEPQWVGEDSLDFLAPSDFPDSLGRIGAYEVKGMLGRGGMGVVLRAFDPALNRNVAIKVVSSGLAASGAARQRFLREARAAAAVVHEHVVSVFAVSESRGLPFLVMEYVPGRSLQDRLDKQGCLTLPEVLRIGMQTASGLAAAHAQGLVHRDVKPANILLEDGIERVRLTDFGLARAAADAAVTHSGVVAGTPHYMAPEQARGDSTDHRADLFSLGATLYATVAGRPPFRAESPLAVLRRVCDEEPRPLREINPETPHWLETMITRLMAKAPANRFASAAEVAGLFARCLAHVQQPQDHPLPDELRQCALKPSRISAIPRWAKIALVAAAVAALGAAFLPIWRRPEQLSPDSRRPREEAQRQSAWSFGTKVARPDDLQILIDELKDRANAIETDLATKSPASNRDVLSESNHELLRRTEILERELRSVGSVRSSSPPAANSSQRR